MDTAVKYDATTILAAMEENQKTVRNMVMESYHDMIEGKGRDYKEFFNEIECRYGNA